MITRNQTQASPATPSTHTGTDATAGVQFGVSSVSGQQVPVVTTANCPGSRDKFRRWVCPMCLSVNRGSDILCGGISYCVTRRPGAIIISYRRTVSERVNESVPAV